MSYCRLAVGHPWHGPYHDHEYGFPVRDDAVLFERLALEINQAGLSWLTVLKKRAAFFEAFRGFDPQTVAGFDDDDRARLLADSRIIRNRLKVAAVIENARRVVALQAEYGSFAAWIDRHHPLPKDGWVALFRKNFKFMGNEIVGVNLMGTGYLPGAHDISCPVHARIADLVPPWMRALQASG